MKPYVLILLCCLSFGLCFGQGVAIQNDRANVIYIGLPNSLTIVANNANMNEVIVTTDNGIIRGEKGHYDIQPATVGTATVAVWKKTAKGKKKLGDGLFRVKRFPDPIVILSGKRNGEIPIDIARKQIAPAAIWDIGAGGCIDAKFTIQHLSIAVFRNQQLKLLKALTNANGVRFTDDPETQSTFEHLEINDRLILFEITGKSPDGTERNLQTADFVISNSEINKY